MRAEPREPKPIDDGAGNVAQRAQQWNAVEREQRRVNNAMRETGDAAIVTSLDRAMAAWNGNQVPWHVVQAAQKAVNDAAKQRPEPQVHDALLTLAAARDEYIRIGGREDRYPGVGGIA